MPVISETGHAKNVANFEDLISFCTAYGAADNPVNPSLHLAGLNTLFTNANAALQDVRSKKISFDNATSLRQEAFKDLKALATRVVNALAVSGVSKPVLADAKTINRKIQGGKRKPLPPPNPGEPTPVQISNSRQSYDSLIDNFALIIQLVSQQPSYAPNEAALQVTGLNTKLNALQAANTSVANAYTEFSNAQLQRQQVLYAPVTGLVPIAVLCKMYIKSLFGGNSPQYRQVSPLEFKTVKK